MVPGAMEFSRFFEIDWEVYRLVPFLIAAAIIMNLTMMWATSKLEGSIHPEVILQSAVLAIVAERIFVTEITSLNDVAPVAAGVLSLFGFSVLYVFKTKRT
ncbi:hypothetical protein So717_43340 [Roseobacter cerasinus]|uniref:Uncharacterized protein n=1 Tax=Roseobacter cerasinus TaxID=2602289 RepID=A0A640VZM8_9RHOB|nr:hypothetical protein So717_43340 [Roseobacter cerasinus]